MKRSGLGRVCAGALCAVLLTACGNGAASPVQAEPLSQVFLAPSPDSRGPLLLVARFETTRVEFGSSVSAEDAELPAVGMSRAEAAAWASERGMRLPTREEWIHLRVEGGAVSRERGRANTLELGIGRSLPVGAIESGRTGLGGYDFEGNVWEWLADEPSTADALPETERQALQAGGSFANYRAGPREAALREAGPNDRASNVGFRVLAEALPWLHDQALPRWRSADAEERKTMAACVALWGAELRVQLERRWLQAYPEEIAFAGFLAGKGSRS
jgi:sulfatase-modifying factor enzyme 1